MSEPTKNPSPFDLLLEQIRAVVREEIRAANDNGHEPDRLLDADEAARVLSVSADWLYKNWPKLPFAVKLHHKMLRFSHAGIQRYIAAKRKAA